MTPKKEVIGEIPDAQSGSAVTKTKTKKKKKKKKRNGAHQRSPQTRLQIEKL